MHAKDLLASFDIRPGDHHAAVKTARAQQSWIESVRAVGSGDQDHALVGFEAVHFHQQSVQGLLAFVVTPAQAGSAVPAHSIDFVDKDDARSVFLALLKKITNAAGADAHEHFHEIG